jgi:hypothetical protein
MVTTDTLIRHHQREITRLRQSIASLNGKPGTRSFIGTFEYQIVQAERAIAIVTAAALQRAYENN